MDTIIQQLTEHAQALARETGGKLTVEMWARVVLEPDKEPKPTFSAYIGAIGESLANDHGPYAEQVKSGVLDIWRKRGAVTDPIQAEVLKMTKRAEELGFALVQNPHVTLEEVR